LSSAADGGRRCGQQGWQSSGGHWKRHAVAAASSLHRHLISHRVTPAKSSASEHREWHRRQLLGLVQPVVDSWRPFPPSRRRRASTPERRRLSGFRKSPSESPDARGDSAKPLRHTQTPVNVGQSAMAEDRAEPHHIACRLPASSLADAPRVVRCRPIFHPGCCPQIGRKPCNS
jgi:hypothetical protein